MAAGNLPAQTPLNVLESVFSIQRVGLMLALAAVIAAVVGTWLWTRTPDYRVLYSNLADRDGGAVLAALQQMNVPYKFAEGGNAILVPENQVHDTRLRLASQGLPKGGLVGFELMENPKLGTSQFLEQVNFQRALEGELARSIQSISAVQAARVHLAISKPSVFVRDQQKPTASVVLNLNAGRVLDPQQVNAIVHLVSSSVPELPVKNVTVLDQHGNLLSAQPAGGVPPLVDPGQLKYVHELEASFARRIEAIVAPIVGAGNVRAQVTADVDLSQVERAEETYKPNQDPANASVRSQQTSEALNGAGANAAGVPGALSNQPPAPAAAPIVGAAPPGTPAKPPAGSAVGAAVAGAVASAPLNSRKDATINYEVDKTIRHVRQSVGSIRRLSAAVILNQRKVIGEDKKVTYVPLTEQEVKLITDLVKEAMGFSQERGDSLNVANRPFTETLPELPADLPFWRDPSYLDLAKTIGRNLLFVLVAVYLYLSVMRPMLRRLMERPEPAPPVAALTEEAAADVGRAGPAARSYENNLQMAKQVAQQEPGIVANVVKGWVSGRE